MRRAAPDSVRPTCTHPTPYVQTPAHFQASYSPYDHMPLYMPAHNARLRPKSEREQTHEIDNVQRRETRTLAHIRAHAHKRTHQAPLPPRWLQRSRLLPLQQVWDEDDVAV